MNQKFEANSNKAILIVKEISDGKMEKQDFFLIYLITKL